MSAPGEMCCEGKGTGQFYLGQVGGRLILLLLRMSENTQMFFTLCCFAADILRAEKAGNEVFSRHFGKAFS